MLHELHRSEKQYLVVKVGEKAKEIFTKLITNFEVVRFKNLKVFTSSLELFSCQWIKQLDRSGYYKRSGQLVPSSFEPVKAVLYICRLVSSS